MPTRSHSTSNKLLIVIAGPTAVGKTAVSIALAKRLKTEIISADSRQIYREMMIGTARPTKQEMDVVPHHFIGNISIHTPFTAADFENQAVALLEAKFGQYNNFICTGGTGLYLRALLEGFDDIPDVSSHVRSQLIIEFEQYGLPKLVEELTNIDPEWVAKGDIENPHRVMRALSVFRETGRPFTSFLNQNKPNRPFDILRICLTMKRERLYERINLRVDKMMEGGLLAEARGLYPMRDLQALQTVGYAELFDHFDGKVTLEKAVSLIQRNTRRFAKRQMTWFRNQGRWTMIDVEGGDVIGEIDQMIANYSSD